MADYPQPLSPEQPAQLRDYLRVVGRRKWTILLVTALFALGGTAYVYFQDPVYRSEARVVVNPQTESPNRQPADLVDLETEAGIAHSVPVAERAARKIGTNLSPGELLDHLEVAAPAETRVLIFTYLDPDAQAAQIGAQAFAEAYLEAKVEDARRDRKAQVDRLEGEIAGLRKAHRTAQAACLESEPQTVERITNCQDAARLRGQMDLLGEDLAEVKAQTVDPADVLGRATQAFAPRESRLMIPIAATFIGLVLGLALAFAREGMDDSLRGATDLERHLGAPVIGIIPKVRGWNDPKVPRLIMLEHPGGTAAESYRTLRTSVMYAAAQRGLRTILITSAFPGEGKTTTAVNLAVALSQAGKRVVLVSADLRKPRIHQFLKLRNEGGITQVLSGERSLGGALVDFGIENLRFLPSGPMMSGQAELLGSEHMAKLIAELATVADFVVIDAPPLVVSDPLTLAPLVDGVLYVADAASTNRGVVARAAEQLEQVGAVLMGAVLNGFDPSKDREESYPSGYGYVYGYQPARQRVGAVRTG